MPPLSAVPQALCWKRRWTWTSVDWEWPTTTGWSPSPLAAAHRSPKSLPWTAPPSLTRYEFRWLFCLFLARHVFYFHCVGLESYWTVIFKWLLPIFILYMNVWLKRGSVISISYDVMNKNTEIENWFSCQWVNLAAWICPVDGRHQISLMVLCAQFFPLEMMDYMFNLRRRVWKWLGMGLARMSSFRKPTGAGKSP